MVFQENHFIFPCHLSSQFSHLAATGVRVTWLNVAFLITISFSSILRANLIKSDVNLLNSVEDAITAEREIIVTVPNKIGYDFMKISNSFVDKWLISKGKEPVYFWHR